MSKRSNGTFERRPRDSYDTPREAVRPLLEQLDPGTRFAEPCAGSGSLLNELVANGHHCQHSSDIEPRGPYPRMDAMHLCKAHLRHVDCIITNPPWDRKTLHPMIHHFRNLRPTWLLIDSDWMFTRQSAEFMPYCSLIVAVGRVSWMQNGTSGFDNAAWYHFVPSETFTIFIGR